MEDLIYDADKETTPNILSIREKYSLNSKSPLVKLPSTNKRIENANIQSRKEFPFLKKMLKKNKIDNIVKNYCNKLRSNNIYRQPYQYVLVNNSKRQFLSEFIGTKQGYEMSVLQTTFFTIVSNLILIILTIFYSLALVFSEIKSNQVVKSIQIVGVIFYFTQLILNFITKKYSQGKAMVHIKEIAFHYLKSKFIIDFLSLVILFIDISLNFHEEFKYVRLFIIIKLYQSLEKLQNIQNIYITTTHRQHYWGLFNVFLINFTFAHILAIMLNAMAFLDTENWLVHYNLQNAPWWQKYIWSYYWGTTTMLTVGYGDFVATNYKEAICLIFIQMISCITLSYNINYVGNLISNIRQQSIQKNKCLKVFRQMSNKNKINIELQNRINNFIEKKYKIKKEYNFQEEDNLLDILPQDLKIQYLNQINVKKFKQMDFLKNLTNKTLSVLASKIQRIVAHPDQIIQKKSEETKFLILNEGEIGFTINNSGDRINGIVVQNISVTNQNSKLLSLGFLRAIPLSYDIKSLSYCVLYYLQKQDLINVFKNSNLDYEHYCQLRDKSNHDSTQIEQDKCDICLNQYHNKFNCPKLHFIPIKQHVINKYCNNQMRIKQNRIGVHRKQKVRINFFKQKNQIIQDSIFIREDLQLNSHPHLPEHKIQVEQTELDSYQQSSILNSKLKNRSDLYLLSAKTTNLDHESLKMEDSNIVEKLMSHFNKIKDFWDLQTDKLYNWKYYFVDNNSSQLQKVRRKKMCIKNI